MKIHRVELQGFGPYREREVVDFDVFEPDGIFLITGRTGAGKTSILDAVTYALFGRLPRYDEAAADKVRSDHIGPTDVCTVSVEFTVATGKYRVTRSPAYERPKKRGEGTTPVKASFELAAFRDGEWEVIEAKEGNADRHVSDVVPLTAEQFQQVILLAQGEFQQFLVADSSTRRDLLSKLFDTSRFTAYCEDLQGRARDLRRDVERSATELRTLLSHLGEQVSVNVPDAVDTDTGAGVSDWVEEILDERSAALAAARAREEEAGHELQQAQARLREGQMLAGRQQRLAAAKEERERLSAQAAEMSIARDKVAVARRAAVVWQAVRPLEVAQAGERERRAGVVRAELAYEEKLECRAPKGREAEEHLLALHALHGSLQSALDDERVLPSLDLTCTARQDAAAAHERRVAESREERARLQEELVELETCATQVAATIAETEGAPLQLEQARAGLAAANECVTLAARLGDVLAEQKDASERHRAAAERYDDLLGRQYAEYAGVLAKDLVDGDACPVCGSVEHPDRAVLAGDHVSVDQADRALAEVEFAAKELAQETAQVTTVRTKLESATERSGGRATGEWQGDVAAASELVQRRMDAVAEAEAIETRRPRVRARMEELEGVLRELEDEGTALIREIAQAEQGRRAARDRVEAARAEHSSVMERVAFVEREASLLTHVIEARTALAHAEEELTRAHTALEGLVREQEFESVESARAARLEDHALAELESKVATYAAAQAAVKQALASPDLQDVPQEPVDLPVLATAEREANERYVEALRESSSHAKQHTMATACAVRIRAALTVSSEVRREYSLVNSLAETVRGQGQNERRIALEAFALVAELEEIVQAANGRLLKMTDGRYEFRHSDAKAARGAQSGLALDVLDSHTGEARSPKSLSGGEKFQASLALALGLSEVVTARAGGIRLDTLFIDEGFGTLDPETLESTMATLDSLREGGRTVGLISHVATLKESIPAQLHVEVTPGGWSTLAQR